jgi:peroxiredoxin
MIFGMVLPWLLLGLGCWIGFQIVKQNGRILLRLESLEKQLERDNPAPRRPTGLPVGGNAPEFALPDLAGERRGLAQFRGRQLVAIFFNPTCGFCSKMVPELAALASSAVEANDRPLPVLISTGDPELNRELFEARGFRGPVLLQERSEVASRYKVTGTPSGYLIDAEGRIASDLAVGAPDLLSLINDPSTAKRNEPREPAKGEDCACGASARGKESKGKANKGLEASKLERNGLKAGTPAPSFRLPLVDGDELALEDYRGRWVLLCFSDPQCGPCDRLAPELERIHQGNPDLAVLMVSRRDLEANRRKVEALGLTFPVALQRNWEISRLYGIFATPVAYLIDPTGVIVSDVGRGMESILNLAKTPVPTIPGQDLERSAHNGQYAATLPD